jgi:hypothetical protein
MALRASIRTLPTRPRCNARAGAWYACHGGLGFGGSAVAQKCQNGRGRHHTAQHFDVAILHFDENVLHPERCGGTLWSDWGESFLRAVEEWDIPKVAVCHGTPQFHGQFDRSYGEPNLGETFEDSRRELVDLLSDVLVVCNSHQARHQWGFRNSMTIWHGFSPYEFPPGRHDRGILSMSRSALTRRPHYNGELIHDRTRDLLDGSMPISSLEVPDPVSAYDVKDQDWSIGKFQNYAATLGQ